MDALARFRTHRTHRTDRIRRPRRSALRPVGITALVLGALLLAGCSGEPSGPSATPRAGTPGAAPPDGSPQPSTVPGGSAEPVFSDEQLAALLATVDDGAGNTVMPLVDATSLRIAVEDGGGFPPRPAAEPAACAVFQPESMLIVPETLSMQFAEGTLPPSAPSATDTTMILLKSAPNSDLVTANFAYTPDQVAACATFTLMDPGSESAQEARLVEVPGVGDQSFATVVTGGLKPGDVQVRLQALTGTVSIGLGRMVPSAGAEAAVVDLAALAMRIVDKVREGAPAVPETPRNEFTPEQLADLLDGVTGPTGNVIDVAGGTTIRPGEGATMPPTEECVYDEGAYVGSQAGASTADGDIQGETKPDLIAVRVTSLPLSAAPPYPFDAKAALFRDCTSVQAVLGGTVTRTWELKTLTVKTAGEASYAVAYRDVEWSVLVGARNGSLSVEAETEARSESELPQAAADLAAVIDQVLAGALG